MSLWVWRRANAAASTARRRPRVLANRGNHEISSGRLVKTNVAENRRRRGVARSTATSETVEAEIKA